MGEDVHMSIDELQKHCYEDIHSTYICEYDLNEIGDKINELITVINELVKHG